MTIYEHLYASLYEALLDITKHFPGIQSSKAKRRRRKVA